MFLKLGQLAINSLTAMEKPTRSINDNIFGSFRIILYECSVYLFSDYSKLSMSISL
jgi:hypothetical protein